MRLSKFSKKWIAYICAIAMVVAGLAFVPAADTKADAPDWSTISYLADGAGGGAYTDKYKFYAENGSTAVNIQNPPWGTAAGIYVGFPAADIQTSLDSVDIQGAGALLHLSNFTDKVTEFTVSWAGGSTTCYVYYEDGAEGPTTEAPSVEPSTEAPSEETSTEDPGPQQLEWTELFDGLGQATVANTSTDTAYGATFEGFVTDFTWGEGGADSVWQGQAKKSGIPVVNGTSYKVSVDLKASSAKNIRVQALTGGQYIEKVYAVDGETHEDFYFTAKGNDVQLVFAFGATSADEAGTYDIEIANMTMEEGEEPTTEAPTGETESPAPVNPYDDWVNTDRNLALLGTASEQRHKEGTTNQLNDGVANKWANYSGVSCATNNPGVMEIALDKAYDAASIDQVAVFWRAADGNFYPSSYEVQFGYKGVFTTVATVSGSDTSGDVVPGWNDDGRYVTDKDFTNDRVASSPVDAVRIYVNVPVEYGAQAREVAVFAEDPQDAPELPQAAAPASVQGNSPDYGTIAFSVTPGEDQDGYTYNVYAGETLIGEGVDGNQEYVAYGFDPGNYTLKAVSIVSGMDPSDPVYSETVTVADPLDLFASDKNKAVGGAITAVSSFYNDNYTLESSQCAVDGTPEAGEGATVCLRTGANQAATIDIDLQKDYDAKDVESFVLAYTNVRTYAANTQIGVSADGENFNEIANATGFEPTKDNQLTANLIPNTSNLTGTFRYVRINLSGGANGWGYCVNQIGVIVNDGEEPSTEAPSESPSVEPSTEAPSVEPSTETPTGSGYDMHRLGYNTWTSLGGVFYAFTGEGNGAQVDVGYNADLNKAKTTQVSGGQWWTWNTQVAAVYPQYTDDVKAGKEYKIKWHIATENGESGNVILTTESGETQVDFSSGDITVEGKLVYNDDIGEAAWCIGTMWIPEGVSVIFDDPEITGEEPTTEAPSVEPSTEAPSESPTVEPSTEAPTVEPTTEAPTQEPTTVEPTTEAPTQEPTTQAPTQKPTQAPTVKPTTPQPVPVIRIPDKAKVKKAVKKKKSAKKIKVKIKKVKGAKGYQVAVYKTKKKAKKNKKALVKKYTTKTKLTIKSKKFKKKKKLYVKVRAYTLDGTVKVFGAWSKPKKTKKK